MTYRDDVVTVNWHAKPNASEVVQERAVSSAADE